MIDAHQWVLLRRCRGARNRPGCQPPPATCLHARCQAQTVAGPAACSHARPGQGSGRAGARAALHELAHHIRAGAAGGPQQGSRLLHQGGAGVDGARHAGCRVPTAQPARSAPAVSPERQARGGAAMPGGRAAPEVSRPPRRSRAPFCGRRSAPGPRAARRAAVRVRTACAAAPARARPSRPQAGGRAAGRARGRASGGVLQVGDARAGQRFLHGPVQFLQPRPSAGCPGRWSPDTQAAHEQARRHTSAVAPGRSSFVASAHSAAASHLPHILHAVHTADRPASL